MRDLHASIEEQRHGQNCAEGCCKAPNDIRRYATLIERTRPTGILEVGTWVGASALWFARTGRCPVLSVDVNHDQVTGAIEGAAMAAGVRFVTGRSTDDHVVDAVRRWAQGKRLLISLDGDHSADTVRAELDLYTPLVEPGGYCVVEDGVMAHVPEQWPHYRGNPLQAIEGWLPAHRDWEPDMEIEDAYETTQHLSGWLRRL